VLFVPQHGRPQAELQRRRLVGCEVDGFDDRAETGGGDADGVAARRERRDVEAPIVAHRGRANARRGDDLHPRSGERAAGLGIQHQARQPGGGSGNL